MGKRISNDISPGTQRPAPPPAPPGPRQPGAVHSVEPDRMKPSGLSPWQGWDKGRDGWAEVKHKDAVCATVFGQTWSMEDAHALISFIEQTWGKPAAMPKDN